MIETRTTWVDTGYDCDHCGGRILKRTDHETGQPDRSCFQCEQCSCQWSLDNRPLRVGVTRQCRTAQKEREREAEEPADVYTRWLLIALAAVLGFVLLRFGGGVALRYVLPLVIVAGVAYFAVRYLRERTDR